MILEIHKFNRIINLHLDKYIMYKSNIHILYVCIFKISALSIIPDDLVHYRYTQEQNSS